MSNPEPLWQPTRERAEQTQIHHLMVRLADLHGFAPEWPAFHQWSIERRDLFWREMFDFAEIQTSAPASATFTGHGMLGTTWFPGLQFNFAQHLLRFNDDRVALAAVDERERTRTITYRELNKAVASLARAMRAAGVSRGDRVGGFLPNIPEAIVAMLATTSLGAAWSSCSPDFGLGGVLDRFGQIEPKMLFAADAYSYNGKNIDSLERVKGIVKKIPSIVRVVIVPFINESPDVSSIPNATVWHEIVGGRGWHGQAQCRHDATASPTASTLAGKPPVAPHKREIEFEQVLFDHPLYIMYSSGTTGIPKCIVHGHGGTLLQHMKELMLHCDLRRDDVIFYFTTCGWMMWNWLVSSLGVGATVVLYEGAPFCPNTDHLWKIAERLGITIFGTSPKFLSACEVAGLSPGRQHDLSKLRAVLSTGSPLTPENFRWVYQNLKSDLQLSSICGGTDIISCFMLGNPMLPVYPGEIQCIGLGMDVQAYSFEGQPVVGQKGELVCCSPFPSQPTGFWNDPDGEKYKNAYFDTYDGVWRHGDFVEVTPRGGVVVYGRSDATLNPGGVRIGTAEIYRQVESLDEVTDSIVVGKDTPDADVEVCLFVVLRDGLSLDTALIDKIKTRIAEGATRRHVPRHIKQVTAIPYTISGKKVEIAVRQMIHGESVPNRDALKNPEALDQYAGIV